MNKSLSILLCGLALLLSTCLDEIEIDNADRPDDGYVVQAKLIRGEPSYVEIKVEQLFFFTSNINRPVSDAIVSLVSKSGDQYDFQGIPLDGIYSAYLDQSAFPVTVGEEYRIEVEISPEIKLQSGWERVYEVPKATKLGWDFTEVEIVSNDGLVTLVDAVGFTITTPLQVNEESARLRWEFIDAYQITDDIGFSCYIENPYQNSQVFLLDGQAIGPDTLTDYPLFAVRIGIRHIDGYYLSAFQQSLSPEAFVYWEQAAALLEREGTVFDNPAGAISTNIIDIADSTRLVYGFFSAYSQDTIRRFISREEMGELDFYCPRPVTGLPNPPMTICDGCIDALGSSYEKPAYWE